MKSIHTTDFAECACDGAITVGGFFGWSSLGLCSEARSLAGSLAVRRRRMMRSAGASDEEGNEALTGLRANRARVAEGESRNRSTESINRGSGVDPDGTVLRPALERVAAHAPQSSLGFLLMSLLSRTRHTATNNSARRRPPVDWACWDVRVASSRPGRLDVPASTMPCAWTSCDRLCARQKQRLSVRP